MLDIPLLLETHYFMVVARAEFAWEFLTQWSKLANITYYESADIIVKVKRKHIISQNVKNVFYLIYYSACDLLYSTI
jgi:hypothetical protein